MPAKDIEMSIRRLLEVSVKRGARIDQICVYMKAQRNHRRDERREYNVRTHFALKRRWGSCLTPAPYRYTFLILSCFDCSLLDCSCACPLSHTTWKYASKQALLPESVSLHLCVPFHRLLVSCWFSSNKNIDLMHREFLVWVWWMIRTREMGMKILTLYCVTRLRRTKSSEVGHQ